MKYANQTITVVAAFVEKDGRMLISQRRSTAFMPYLWEFPGGKVEAGESNEEALAREIHEEMGVEIATGELVDHLTQDYTEFNVHLFLYRAEIVLGEIQKIGVEDFRWATRHELSQFTFAPADDILIKRMFSDPTIGSR